jgi:hypothetical protein
MENYFGEDGVLTQTAVVDISGGFHVTVGILDAKQDDECKAILSGNRPSETRIVSRGKGTKAIERETEQVTEMTVEYREYREAVLLRGIREWDLTEKGAIAPIDLAHIRKLSNPDRNKIFVRIDELNEPISEEEKGK